MSVNATITFNGLPPPFYPDGCWGTPETLAQAIIDNTVVTLPSGYAQWIIQQATPGAGDQDKAWLRTDSNGYPIEALLWVTAAGRWVRWFTCPLYCTSVAGAANAFALTFAPTVGVLQTGKVFQFISNQTTSGACTVAIDANAAVAIKKNGNVALDPSDILNGQVVSLMYDGTVMQMISPPATLFKKEVRVFGNTTTAGATPPPTGPTLSLTKPASGTWQRVRYDFIVVFFAKNSLTIPGASATWQTAPEIGNSLDTTVATNIGNAFHFGVVGTGDIDVSFVTHYWWEGPVPADLQAQNVLSVQFNPKNGAVSGGDFACDTYMLSATGVYV